MVRKRGILIIFMISLILILPQFFMKTMVIGSDSIFHFNRFYDISSQIKEGNFQYFIHMYGFQQSGRIVNALYGPGMAYIQGLLVLISPSWFVYQIFSNGLLYVISGISIYIFLKCSSVKERTSIYFSLLFMTTFSIQYWTTRQGFTSWGAALFPLCLLPIIQFKKNNKFNVLQVAIMVAIMTQVHLFTTVLLIIVYFSYFMVLFFKREINKLKLLLQLCLSILIYGVLTCNIWYALFFIYKENSLVAPFVNKTMYLNTITANSFYWLITPIFIIIFIGIKVYYDIKCWKKYDIFSKVSTFLILFFFILTTNLIPWKILSSIKWLNLNIIQFPFRFFIPFTVLLFLSTAIKLDKTYLLFRKKRIFNLILVCSLIQTIGLSVVIGMNWYTMEPIKSSHTTIYTEDYKLLRNSFFSNDKLLSLQLVQKSTPDYLPSYKDDSANKYEEYKKYVIDENYKFKKNVIDKKLIVTWEGDMSKRKNIPVIVYHNTDVVHNGKRLDKNKIQLSSIGTPTIIEKEGKNMLEVSYKENNIFLKLLCLSIISWICSLIFLLLRLFYKVKIE